MVDIQHYNRVHQWNLRHWTKKGVCSFCNKQARTHWSNKSEEYRLGDRFDWQEVCPSCHALYDDKNTGKTYLKRCSYCRGKFDHLELLRPRSSNFRAIRLCYGCWQFERFTQQLATHIKI